MAAPEAALVGGGIDCLRTRTETGEQPTMTNKQPARVLDALMYEVLKTTTMLLFLLSGISMNRRKQYEAPGVARPLALPGLPQLCLSPCIVEVPDEELYGSGGEAAQLAFKGWIVDVFALWENRYRKELKEALGPRAIRPELEAFGDLRRIRNDLLHNNGYASRDHCGKCTILTWFTPGEATVFALRHVLDFLNQLGVLSLGGRAHHDESGSCLLQWYQDADTLVNWTPEPRLISVRTHDDGRDETPPIKGVTVVFDNGVFANVPFAVASEGEWLSLGRARIDSDGRLMFANGIVVGASEIYRSVVSDVQGGSGEGGRLRRPVAGPPIRFGR